MMSGNYLQKKMKREEREGWFASKKGSAQTSLTFRYEVLHTPQPVGITRVLWWSWLSRTLNE